MLQIVTKLFKSKTLIVNWVTLIVGVLGVVAGSEVIKDYPEITASIVSAVAALNVVLRWVTVAPLEDKASLNRLK